jgi:hypothetical protein
VSEAPNPNRQLVEALGRAIASRDPELRGLLADQHSDVYRQLGLIERRTKDAQASLSRVTHLLDRQAVQSRTPLVSPRQLLIRAIAARFLARCRGIEPDDVVASLWRNDPETHRALAHPGRVTRAAVAPAMTGVPGWAAEIVPMIPFGTLEALAPQSVYARLAPRGVRLSFEGTGSVRVPSRASGELAGSFIGEGRPIPMKQLSLAAVPVAPKKLGVISAFTAELANRSLPSIESVIRTAVADDTGEAVDTLMLDDQPDDGIRPAGLLSGVAALTPTPIANGSQAALASDLAQLAGAIEGAADLVYVTSEADRVRALLLAPGALALTILPSTTMPAGRVVALDAADLVTGEGDEADIDVTEDVTLLADDAPPGDGTLGRSVLSMWQQQFIALRLRSEMAWAMRRPGRIAFVENVTW